MASTTSQSFGTVLVARKSSDPPSEIERILRHWTKTLRVVASLSGGAHFVFRGTSGGASAAVRVYDTKSILRIESEASSQKKTSPMHAIENTIRYLSILNGTEPDQSETPGARGGPDSDLLASNVEPGQTNSSQKSPGVSDAESIIDDTDGLRAFRDSFKDPMCIFVLPPGQLQQEQLGRSNSFFMRAQRTLGGRNTSNEKQAMARVFIVPDVDSALRTVSSVLESIRPEKLELKKQYFENEAVTKGLPDAATGHPPSEDAVARQAAGAFRAWAQDAGIPDSDVLFTALGTLDKISAADGTVLDTMPLEETTKTAVMSFFGSGTYVAQHEVGHEENPTNLVQYDSGVQNQTGPAFSAPMPPQFAAATATTAQTQVKHLNFTPMQPSFNQAQALQQHDLNDQQNEPPLLQQQVGPYSVYPNQLQGQPNAHQPRPFFHSQQESFHQYRYPGPHHQDTPQYRTRHIGSRTVRQPSTTTVIPSDRARSTSWSGMEPAPLRYSYSTQRFGGYR